MAKNPFVTPEFETYQYPAPLDAPQRDGETDVAYENRLAMIDPEEAAEGHWIKLRVPRSRDDVDKVADYSQSIVAFGDNGDGAKLEQRISRGNRGVFELLVEGWSFDDAFGMKPTATNYAKLDLWAGDWIVACLADVGEKGTKRDYAKKTGSTSKKPAASRASSSEEDS